MNLRQTDTGKCKELQGMGIQPDIIVCRSEHPLDQSLKDKIALFCNVPNGNVLQNLDVEYLYEAPLAMEKENLAKVACKALHLDCPEPDLKDWESMVERPPSSEQESKDRFSRKIYRFA